MLAIYFNSETPYTSFRASVVGASLGLNSSVVVVLLVILRALPRLGVAGRLF